MLIWNVLLEENGTTKKEEPVKLVTKESLKNNKRPLEDSQEPVKKSMHLCHKHVTVT